MLIQTGRQRSIVLVDEPGEATKENQMSHKSNGVAKRNHVTFDKNDPNAWPKAKRDRAEMLFLYAAMQAFLDQTSVAYVYCVLKDHVSESERPDVLRLMAAMRDSRKPKPKHRWTAKDESEIQRIVTLMTNAEKKHVIRAMSKALGKKVAARATFKQEA